MLTQRRYLLPLIGLLLLASALSVRWLARDVLFVDEWWSIYKSGGDIYGPLSPAGIIDRIVTVDPGGMGGGYYLALGGWQGLVGSTPFAVRAFSMLFGLLAVAMTFRLGMLWFSPRVGFIAAALMASSAFFVNFMHEARAYTLVAFLICCTAYSYWRLVGTDRPRVAQYAALTLSLAGLAYAHYIVLPGVVAALGAYHVLFVPKNRRWLNISGAMIAAAALFVFWLPVVAEVARRGAGDTNRQADSMAAGQAVEVLATAFANGSPALLVLLLAVGAWLLASTPRDRIFAQLRRSPAALLVCWLLGGLAGSLLLNAAIPFLVHLRYLMFLWPALAIAAALGIETLRRRGVPLTLIVGVWMAFGVAHSLSPDFMRGLFGEIYRPPAAGIERAMDVLDDLYQPDDLVLFHIEPPGFEPFGLFIEDYLTRHFTGVFPNTTARAQTEMMNNDIGAQTDAEYKRSVLTILGDHPRVWILDVPEIAETQRTRTLADTLAESYADCGMPLVRDDATLQLFARTPDTAALDANPPRVYGDDSTGIARMQILSEQATGAPFTVAPDGIVSLTLGWLSDEALRGGMHSVAVHLVDSAGNVVRQDDYALPHDRYGCHISVFAADLPDGVYQFYVSVYQWQTLERLPVAGSPDGRILLGDVEIKR